MIHVRVYKTVEELKKGLNKYIENMDAKTLIGIQGKSQCLNLRSKFKDRNIIELLPRTRDMLNNFTDTGISREVFSVLPNKYTILNPLLKSLEKEININVYMTSKNAEIAEKEFKDMINRQRYTLDSYNRIVELSRGIEYYFEDILVKSM